MDTHDMDKDIDEIHNLCTTIEESLHAIIDKCDPHDNTTIGDDKPFKYIKDACEAMLPKFKDCGEIYSEIIEIKARLGWFENELEERSKQIGAAIENYIMALNKAYPERCKF